MQDWKIANFSLPIDNTSQETVFTKRVNMVIKNEQIEFSRE